MAALFGRSGSAIGGDTTSVDTTKQQQLGTRAFDTDGNEYIYLQGVGSTAAGSWVTFDEAFVTTLLAADAIGRVGVAMAAVDATTKYGWYQIYGKNTVAKSDTTADDKPLYADGTAGRVDDAGSAGDFVFGAWSRSADSSNVLTVELNYPFVANSGYLT